MNVQTPSTGGQSKCINNVNILTLFFPSSVLKMVNYYQELITRATPSKYVHVVSLITSGVGG